jgi:hypothetical protein
VVRLRVGGDRSGRADTFARHAAPDRTRPPTPSTCCAASATAVIPLLRLQAPGQTCKNLLEAERGFRDLKTHLLLRPVFHRLEHRIRAHVLICWLALLLTRVAERGSGLSWRTINRQLGRITQVTLAGPAGTAVQTTPLTTEQKAIYQALSTTPPARITAFNPT